MTANESATDALRSTEALPNIVPVSWATGGDNLPFVDGLNLLEIDAASVPGGDTLTITLPSRGQYPAAQFLCKFVTGTPGAVALIGSTL